MAETVQKFPESSAELEETYNEMSLQLLNLRNGIDKVATSGEVPQLLNGLVAFVEKERTEVEILLTKKVDSLEQELKKSLNENKILVYKSLKNIPGIRVYNE